MVHKPLGFVTLSYDLCFGHSREHSKVLTKDNNSEKGHDVYLAQYRDSLKDTVEEKNYEKILHHAISYSVP